MIPNVTKTVWFPIDYFRAIWHHVTMETRICSDMKHFLAATGISARRLAIEAGVNPVDITRVVSGARKDMTSAKADAIRAAMARLSQPDAPTDLPVDEG